MSVESLPRTAAPDQSPEAPARATQHSALSTQHFLLDVLAVVLIVGYVLVSLVGLTRWPPLVNDEGREASLFWVASGADPSAERINAYRGFPTWGNGGLQGATSAAIFRLVGVGVFQARLTSLLWGGVLLLLVYLLGRQYWNRVVGLAAAAMLAVSDPFLVSSHTLRPDVQVAALTIGALLLAELSMIRTVRLPPAHGGMKGGFLALLAGLLLGLGVDVHPNTFAFMPLVALVFPLRQGWGFWRRGEAWLFVGGLALAALYYLAVRVLPDPSGFQAGMRYWLGVDKAPPAAREGIGVLGAISSELERYWDYFGEEPLELALVLAGLVAGLWWAIRGSYPARLILLGLAAAVVFFVFAVSTKSKYYMLLTYPFYMLLAARLFERIASFIGGLRASPVLTYGALAVLVGLAAYYPLRVVDRAWDNYIRAHRYRAGQEYTQLTDRFDQLAGPGARILAPPVYWIGLHEHPYVDIYVYERVSRQYGMSAAEFLNEVRPDFVITDAKIATDRRIERLLYNELDARAPRELIVRHKNYGDVAVYRLRW